MAIKDKGYGESGRCGFERAIAFTDEGKATDYMEADELVAREDWYLEVIGLDLWETDKGQDFLTVDLFEPRSGLVTKLFGEIKSNTMWKLDRSIESIFGKPLPADDVQGPGGRMPLATRKAALGTFVKVQVRDGKYDRQDVLIVGGPFAAPDGVKPMFGADHEATGAWPTSAAELIKVRGQGPADGGTPSDDDEDW